MFRQSDSGKRLMRLIEAFGKDGFEVGKIVVKFGKTGIMAESRSAVNYDTRQKKKAYYLEGSCYEMGFLMGLLAENEIAAMTGDFTNKVVFSFIGSKILEKITLLQDALVKILYELAKSEFAKLPNDIRDEIRGILDGCKSYNPKTTVTLDRLIVLNLGIDILCSMVYTGDFPLFRLKDMDPDDFTIPVMCNAFSVFGKSAGNGHYFGRDFMFSTADVFHKTACMIVYNPSKSGKASVYPFVSITAPGMVGSISAMNGNGVGIGVDMSPGCNCDPRNPGVNSLLMTRLCIQNGGSAEEMVDIIENTPRGVSWNYIISDGRQDRACVVETGKTGNIVDFTEIPLKDFKAWLPDAGFISSHSSSAFRKGLMVRWNDYKYPEAYLSYNDGLWKEYNKTHTAQKEMYPDAFAARGYIDRQSGEKNCPSAFYFCPQRETSDELLIVTNHYIIPEMRYFAMHPWTCRIAGEKADDIQWRYDELNDLISGTLQRHGKISYESAKELVSYLAPSGRNPGYYLDNPKSRDGKETRIEGCSSVFDLKNRYVESHYGYYCDEWVKITLPNYVN
ncbi:MAG: hypothetical protein FIA99_15870 [Ruminiclostridium sp.]|nr:hypothetical protein [Ruminiclostridium sp.]